MFLVEPYFFFLENYLVSTSENEHEMIPLNNEWL